jgi:hypothetical protein
MIVTCCKSDRPYRGCVLWSTKAAAEADRREHECGEPAVAYMTYRKQVMGVCAKHFPEWKRDDPAWVWI